MCPLHLGPPPVHLPEGWADRIPVKGLRLRTICRRVYNIEQEGNPRVYRQLNPKGYTVIYLGRYHPYARPNGLQTLHRWIAMRHLGRVLAPYEHVHHREGAAKNTTNFADLVIMQDVTHGQYHYGTHFIRSSVGTLIWVGCKNDKTEEELMQDGALLNLHAALDAVGIKEVQVTRSQAGYGDWIDVFARNENGAESRVIYVLDRAALRASPHSIEFLDASVVRYLVGKTLVNLSRELFPVGEEMHPIKPVTPIEDGNASS